MANWVENLVQNPNKVLMGIALYMFFIVLLAGGVIFAAVHFILKYW